MWVAETARLRLRQLEPGDLDFVADMLGHPEVSRYYETHFDREASAAWLERQRARYRSDGHGLWLVVEQTTGAPVGQVGLLMQEVEGERRPEIGWLLHRPYWGRGYATEAALATRDVAAARFGYAHVISLIRPENLPSQAVARRVGMAPGREVPFHGYRHVVWGMPTRPGGEHGR
jgi:RimJ/RimL family protein N-acetyltransferase